MTGREKDVVGRRQRNRSGVKYQRSIYFKLICVYDKRCILMKAISWKYLSLKQLLQNHFDGTLTRKRENSDTVVSSRRSEGVCIALLNVCIRFQNVFFWFSL